MPARAVTDNRPLQRYEMTVDGQIAFVRYRREGAVFFLEHAEVPGALRGRGIGADLVRATLEALRAEGWKAVPRCSFVRAFMRAHSEFDDLRAE